MRSLRALLIVDALALALSTTVSDPIVADVVLLPVLLVGVLVAVACLGADLVEPRRRIAVICSALTIIAPFPFLLLPGRLGPVAAALAITILQVLPLVRDSRPDHAGGPATPALRRVIAALVFSTGLLLVTVAALVLYGNAYLLRPAAGAFTRGPYLTRVTATEAELAWHAKTGAGAVQLRVLAPDGASMPADNGRFSHLQPDTRYTWTANIAGNSRATGAFRTAPTSASSPITLVAFGDYGSGNSHEYAVGRLAAAADPALVLSAGDNAYLLAAPPLLNRAIFDPLRGLLGEAPMVAALGEHDLAWRNGAAVISALRLPGHHYSVQYGPVQVVVLGLEADRSALAYAAQALGRCRSPCPVRFVLTHRQIAANNPIMPLLRQRQVAAIIAAHLHRYERAVRAGVLELTVGTGGEGPGGAQYTRPSPDAQVSSLAYGFLRIDIQGSSIRYMFVDESGTVRDQAQRRIGQ